MKKKLLVRYLSFIVIVTLSLGFFHHHNDIQDHNDCDICVLQQNITDIDTPIDVNYLTLFSIPSEATITSLQSLQTQEYHSTFSARAPPLFS